MGSFFSILHNLKYRLKNNSFLIFILMKITLDIPEDKVSFFLELIENLNFTPLKESISVPEWQQKEVAKRIYAIETGEMEVKKWEDVKREIFGKK